MFFIDDFRGKGLSKVLLKKNLEDSRFNNVKKLMLATHDAHELYKKFKFKGISLPEKLM
jgi:N-acetylglutamate synthase-like GNAT family acetyltransferase